MNSQSIVNIIRAWFSAHNVVLCDQEEWTPLDQKKLDETYKEVSSLIDDAQMVAEWDEDAVTSEIDRSTIEKLKQMSNPAIILG